MTGRLRRPARTVALTSRRSGGWATARVQSGFGLVSAIFLLLVLSSLGAAIVTVFTVQQASSAQDVLGARAYQAARAGIEWGLYQQLRVPPPGASDCFGVTSFGFPGTSTLSSFKVTVLCVMTPGPGSLKRWQIRAVACNQSVAGALACPNRSDSADYVEREVQVEY
jgi:MSHA biogenesis protein MshP